MKILVAAPVRQKPHIYEEHVRALSDLIVPGECELDVLHIFHGCKKELYPIYAKLPFTVHDYEEYPVFDAGYECDEVTHRWGYEHFGAVVSMKELIQADAIRGKYDYIYYVDSDLILAPNALEALLKAKKGMVSNVFWTKWGPEHEPLPNAWQAGHYEMTRGFIDQLRRPGTYQCGMTGACTLVHRKVFTAANWLPIYNVPYTMWEDRAYCIRVAAAGHDIHCSSEAPVLHLYREEDYHAYTQDRSALQQLCDKQAGRV